MKQNNRLTYYCAARCFAILMAVCLLCAPTFGQINAAAPASALARATPTLSLPAAKQTTSYPGGNLRIAQSLEALPSDPLKSRGQQLEPTSFKAANLSPAPMNLLPAQAFQAGVSNWPGGPSPMAVSTMSGGFMGPQREPFVFRLNHRFGNMMDQAPVPRFDHPDANDPHRHIGRGQPLYGTSWLNRPYHIGWFVGALFGDNLISGRVDQGEGLFGGYRFGADFDHYWGWEGRFGFGNVNIIDNQSPPVPRTGRDMFWDISLVYYPWGDARWRPYALMGVGLANFQFEDEFQRDVSGTSLHMPMGIGFKYYWKNWLALRADMTGNVAFGSSELRSMFNGSLTFGMEMHYGAKRRTYYPWNPALRHW